MLRKSTVFGVNVGRLLSTVSSFVLPPTSISGELSTCLCGVRRSPGKRGEDFLGVVSKDLELQSIMEVGSSRGFVGVGGLGAVCRNERVGISRINTGSVTVMRSVRSFQVKSCLNTGPYLVRKLSRRRPTLGSSIQPSGPRREDGIVSTLGAL